MARLACLWALAAAAVVSTASGAGCASDAYCAAQPGCDQPDLVTCLESVCYTGTADARCDGRDCGFDLGDGGWCCDGRRDSMCCNELSGVQRDLCEWHSVVGGGGTAIDATGLDACRAWCDAEASCFAIQWVPGEDWCDGCTGWANSQGVDSMSSWAATSGDAEVQTKECWQSSTADDYLGYENACREWGHPKEGKWNVDEDCCAGKKQMACADGYRLENTGNVCYEDDCTTAYNYHCIACDPASACMGDLDEDGEDYGCEDNVGLLILIICLPIGVVLICIGIGCCICHSRRQAQQRQAQAAANAQMAHVQMAPVPKSYAYNTQQRAEEMYNQIATWYNAPENAALRARWGAFPDPDEFQTWPGFVAVTNAFLDQGAIVGEQQPVLQGVLVLSAPPIELQGVVVGEESR